MTRMKIRSNRCSMSLGVITFALMLGLLFACSTSESARREKRIDDLRKRDSGELTDAERVELLLEFEFDKAERYISLGQYDFALEIVQSIITGHPGTIYADRSYYLKGFAYSNMLNFDRDLEKAAAAFRMVIASDPVSFYDIKAQEMLDKIQKRQ